MVVGAEPNTDEVVVGAEPNTEELEIGAVPKTEEPLEAPNKLPLDVGATFPKAGGLLDAPPKGALLFCAALKEATALAKIEVEEVGVVAAPPKILPPLVLFCGALKLVNEVPLKAEADVAGWPKEPPGCCCCVCPPNNEPAVV